MTEYPFSEVIRIAKDQVPEAPQAMVFTIPAFPQQEQSEQAFLYKLEGQYYGFINRCTHVHIPLDMDDARFFDLDGLIICRLHGARYDPKSGARLIGPARSALRKLMIKETEQELTISGCQIL